MTEITRQFKRQSANRFSAVFSEIVAENEAPIIGDLSVQKWWVGTEQKLLITITIPDKKKEKRHGDEQGS
jgi:hypothetical protein